MSGFTYVAKPERIQAFDMSLMNSPKVIHMPQWLLDAIVTKRINSNACMSEGVLVAIQLTDYIVRTADGELHVWSKEAFERRYMPFMATEDIFCATFPQHTMEKLLACPASLD